MALFDSIKSLKASKAAVVGVVFGLIYYLALFDGGQKEKDGIKQADQELQDLGKEVARLEEILMNVKRLEQAEKELGASISKVINYIPDDLTYSEMVRSLSEATRAVGLDIGYKRTQAGKGEFYDEIAVHVDLVGRFDELVSFLAELTKVGRIYTVDKMDFNVRRGVKDGHQVQFTTTVVGYRYRNPMEDQMNKEEK